MPAEPRAPKALADPEALAARRALIDSPHIAPIRALAARVAAERGAPVPAPDPLDGGVGARMLLLLETPGPAVLRTGFVTRDSANGTAANLFRFLAGAGPSRPHTIRCKGAPWLTPAAGPRTRAPRRAEVAAAAPYLAPLLDLLPRLAVAVLAGRFAGEAAPALAALRPDLPVIRVPHPSPTYVCTAPEVPERIRRGLAEAAAILDRTSG